jgi:uncharacterized protein (DUF1800 family)
MRQSIALGGVQGWVDEQLKPEVVPDPAVDAALTGFDLLDAGPPELRDRATAARAHAQTEWAGFTRAFISERQVNEAVVGVWREHFAVSLTSRETVLLDQTLRRYALSDHRDLLVAVAQSPGVLRVGRAGAVNGGAGSVSTSFARLIVDHFGPGSLTVGEMRGVAEVLSGWGTDPAGDFVYDAARHHAAPARIGGWMTPGRGGAAGFDVGVSLLCHLATMPVTARRVAEALSDRLVGDAATSAVVDRCAGAHLAGRADVAAAVGSLLVSPGSGGSTARGRGTSGSQDRCPQSCDASAARALA